MGFFLCFVHKIFNGVSTWQCMVMIFQMKSVLRLSQPLYNKIRWDLMIWRNSGSSKTFLLKLLTKVKIKFFIKISVLVRQICVPLLMSETSEYSVNIKFKMTFFSFFLSIDCKELLNIKERLMRRYRHQIYRFCACQKKWKKKKKWEKINFWNCHFSPDFRCE